MSSLPPLVTGKTFHASLCVRAPRRRARAKPRARSPRVRAPVCRVTSRARARSLARPPARRLDAYRERAEGGGSPVVPGTHLQRLPKPTMAELKEKKRRRARAQCHAERWWEKRPTIAGEACNERQGRLCEVESFTGLYKRRFDPSKAAMRAVSGDYCADPLGAERMLQSKTCAELTIPGRAADFRTEVEWRMRLRSRGVGGGLPPLPGGASAHPPRLLRLDRIK